MTTLAITLASVLFLMAAVQAYELWMCAKFIRAAKSGADSQYTPKVAVMMTLRGADPDLHDGLVRLLTQDYPDYELRIIVDAENDPAWKVVEQAMKTAGNNRVKLAPLTQRGLSRSLYCSALVQAAAGVDESFEAVVLMDGDVVPHKTWLRELIAPLENKNVGAAFGNRWYFPTEGRIGSLVRYVWNQGAVAFMRRCKMPWAGSLAIRRSDLVETGLFDRWSNGLVADAPTPAAMATMGRDVVFVPTVLIANREECDLSTCREFLKRQHLWGCLYHKQWPAIAVYTWVSSAILAATGLFLAYSALNGDGINAAWLAGGLAAYAGLLT
ncbi:MAG TPA: glycosyltransferase family 2 protein, partial [Pirellulales bacterium]